ncbi:MAG: hypothetical protein O2960_18395 [Verrucomicrobia bacterium]|nr:hypothetical protein [Verrucomicrobiota bacterium]
MTSLTGAAISETVTTDEVLSDGLEVKKTKVDGGLSFIKLKNSANGDGDDDDDDGGSGNVQLSTGDQIKVTGKLFKDGVEVVSDGDTFFVRQRNGNDKQFGIFLTQSDAENNVNQLDIGQKNQETLTSIQKVETAASSIGINLSLTTKLNESNLAGFNGANGSFKINGTTVNFNGSDTFQDLLTKINDSGAGVTATLDQSTRQVTLTNSATGATDISVTGESTGLAASLGLTNRTTTLGTADQTLNVNINEGTQLNASNLAGFSGANGSFQINGKTIGFSGTDTIGSLLSTINNSGAGVTATLDQNSRQITLTNDATGASDITVASGSTGLAASLGLTNRTTTLGNDTEITANGNTFTTKSNTISGSTFGVSGIQIDIGNLSAGDSAKVTLNAAVKGESVLVADPDDVTAVAKGFLDQLNKVQAFLEENAEAGGRVFDEVSRSLRGAVRDIFSNSALSGGVNGSGTSNQINVDASALEKGIKGGALSVLNMFGDSGFAAKAPKVASSFLGSTGTLSREISRDKKAEAEISNRLDDLSDKEKSNRLRLDESLSGIAQSLIAIQGQKSFLEGVGTETSASRASKTREGSTGLNLSGQLEQIQERARKAGVDTNRGQGVDLKNGLAGIEDFLSTIFS